MDASKSYTQQINTRVKTTGVLLFGDSVLFGTGASTRNVGCGRILGMLLAETPVTIKGKNRDTTKDGLQRLKSDVLQDTISSHVIILFGNNDCRLIDIDRPIVSLEEYRDNLKEIIRQIKAVGKIPILSNLQPINSGLFYKTLPDMRKFMVKISSPSEWHRRYSLICEEVVKKESIKLADIRSTLNRYGNSVIADDGLHPNDLGHKIIAQKFFETLKENL